MKTLQTAVEYFQKLERPLTALGIGSFGPIDLNTASSTYGYITSTPKAGWRDCDVVTPFKSLNVPISFNTDVNTAALGEFLHGHHGTDVHTLVYVTVGTGIGAGVVTNGHILDGVLLHPEAGHILVRRHKADEFEGVCPFHGDCLEGLTTANSVAKRLGIDIHDLKNVSDDDGVWDQAAYYLAQLCVNMTLILSPHVIVLGGGSLQRRSLFPRIREHFTKLMNGYIRHEKVLTALDRYIVPSRFDAADSKTSPGCVGTLTHAQFEYNAKKSAAAKQ